MNWISCFLYINLLICLGFRDSLFAGPPDSLQKKRLTLEYQLYKTGNDENTSHDLNLKIANVYKEEGKYLEAVEQINSVDLSKVDSLKKTAYYYTLAVSYFLADSNSTSNTYLQETKDKLSDQDSLRYLTSLEIMNYNLLGRFDTAYTLHTRALLYLKKDTTGLYSAYGKAINEKYFSIRKAARLSRIFPGAGLFYVEEPGKGATSLIVCLTALGYTAYSVYDRYYVTAALTGLTNFLRFYGGGVKTAARNADFKNKDLIQNHAEHLNQMYVSTLLR